MTIMPDALPSRPQRPGDALVAAGIPVSSPQQLLALHSDWPRLADDERVTPEVAARLSVATGATERFWLNCQEAWDNYRAHAAANTSAAC